jgi:hypothetical protein
MAEAEAGAQRLMLVGALLGLAVIPISIVYRARVFKSRSVSSFGCWCLKKKLDRFTMTLIIQLPCASPNPSPRNDGDRHDIHTEMVPVLYERFIQLKAALDYALGLTILAGACRLDRSTPREGGGGRIGHLSTTL